MNGINEEEFVYDHYKNLVNRQELDKLITLCNTIRKIVLDIEWMANFGVGFRNYNLDVDLNEIDNYVIQADFPREDFIGTPFEDVESKDFLHKMFCTKEQLFSKVNKFLKESKFSYTFAEEKPGKWPKQYPEGIDKKISQAIYELHDGTSLLCFDKKYRYRDDLSYGTLGFLVKSQQRYTLIQLHYAAV